MYSNTDQLSEIDVPGIMTNLEPYIEQVVDSHARKVMSKVDQTAKQKKQVALSPVAPSANSTMTKSPRNFKVDASATPSAGSPKQVKKQLYQSMKSPVQLPSLESSNMNSPVPDMYGQRMIPGPLLGHVFHTSPQFDNAIESLAAMKMHDFILNRKNRKWQRNQLTDEIRTYKLQSVREMENEIYERVKHLIAAWKIRFYVEAYRFKSLRHHTNRTLQRQGIELQVLKDTNEKLSKTIDEGIDASLSGYSLKSTIKNLEIQLEKRDRIMQDFLEEKNRFAVEADALRCELELTKSSYRNLCNNGNDEVAKAQEESRQLNLQMDGLRQQIARLEYEWQRETFIPAEVLEKEVPQDFRVLSSFGELTNWIDGHVVADGVSPLTMAQKIVLLCKEVANKQRVIDGLVSEQESLANYNMGLQRLSADLSAKMKYFEDEVAIFHEKEKGFTKQLHEFEHQSHQAKREKSKFKAQMDVLISESDVRSEAYEKQLMAIEDKISLLNLNQVSLVVAAISRGGGGRHIITRGDGGAPKEISPGFKGDEGKIFGGGWYSEADGSVYIDTRPVTGAATQGVVVRTEAEERILNLVSRLDTKLEKLKVISSAKREYEDRRRKYLELDAEMLSTEEKSHVEMQLRKEKEYWSRQVLLIKDKIEECDRKQQENKEKLLVVKDELRSIHKQKIHLKEVLRSWHEDFLIFNQREPNAEEVKVGTGYLLIAESKAHADLQEKLTAAMNLTLQSNELKAEYDNLHAKLLKSHRRSTEGASPTCSLPVSRYNSRPTSRSGSPRRPKSGSRSRPTSSSPRRERKGEDVAMVEATFTEILSAAPLPLDMEEKVKTTKEEDLKQLEAEFIKEFNDEIQASAQKSPKGTPGKSATTPTSGKVTTAHTPAKSATPAKAATPAVTPGKVSATATPAPSRPKSSQNERIEDFDMSVKLEDDILGEVHALQVGMEDNTQFDEIVPIDIMPFDNIEGGVPNDFFGSDGSVVSEITIAEKDLQPNFEEPPAKAEKVIAKSYEPPKTASNADVKSPYLSFDGPKTASNHASGSNRADISGRRTVDRDALLARIKRKAVAARKELHNDVIEFKEYSQELSDLNLLRTSIKESIIAVLIAYRETHRGNDPSVIDKREDPALKRLFSSFNDAQLRMKSVYTNIELVYSKIGRSRNTLQEIIFELRKHQSSGDPMAKSAEYEAIMVEDELLSKELSESLECKLPTNINLNEEPYLITIPGEEHRIVPPTIASLEAIKSYAEESVANATANLGKAGAFWKPLETAGEINDDASEHTGSIKDRSPERTKGRRHSTSDRGKSNKKSSQGSRSKSTRPSKKEKSRKDEDFTASIASNKAVVGEEEDTAHVFKESSLAEGSVDSFHSNADFVNNEPSTKVKFASPIKAVTFDVQTSETLPKHEELHSVTEKDREGAPLAKDLEVKVKTLKMDQANAENLLMSRRRTIEDKEKQLIKSKADLIETRRMKSSVEDRIHSMLTTYRPGGDRDDLLAKEYEELRGYDENVSRITNEIREGEESLKRLRVDVERIYEHVLNLQAKIRNIRNGNDKEEDFRPYTSGSEVGALEDVGTPSRGLARLAPPVRFVEPKPEPVPEPEPEPPKPVLSTAAQILANAKNNLPTPSSESLTYAKQQAEAEVTALMEELKVLRGYVKSAKLELKNAKREKQVAKQRAQDWIDNFQKVNSRMPRVRDKEATPEANDIFSNYEASKLRYEHAVEHLAQAEQVVADTSAVLTKRSRRMDSLADAVTVAVTMKKAANKFQEQKNMKEIEKIGEESDVSDDDGGDLVFAESPRKPSEM